MRRSRSPRAALAATSAAVWLALEAAASAVTYRVRIDGSGDFTTIQACASVARAGDTCLVAPGTYDEVVSPVSSGSAGSLIRFTAEGKAIVAGFRISGRTHIAIEGFEITYLPSSRVDAAIHLAGAHSTEITATDIHHVDGIGIWLHHGSPSNRVVIRNNRIRFTDCIPGDCIGGGGIVCNGDDVRIEGNDISHVGDFTNTWGQRIVLRNNIFHDVYNSDFPEYFQLPVHDPLGHHVDAVQHFAATNALHFLLFEDNVVRDVPLANVHGGIFQDQDGVVSDSDVVYRHNLFHTLGGALIIINPFRDLRAVNNTMAGLNSYSPRGNTVLSAASGTGPSSNIKLINNLFHDSTRQVTWATPYSIDAGSQLGFHADHNLCYQSGTPSPLEANGILDQDPRFADPTGRDFTLATGSPAIDAGGALTRVAASDPGTGNTLEVDDARFFQDGWAGARADSIAVGDPATIADVVAIDYPQNRITLSRSLTRTASAPVWLHGNASGRIVLTGVAPDIGYSERVPGAAPVTGLKAVRMGVDDIRLSWDGNPPAAGYNVWYVGEKQNLPLARQWREPHAVGVTGCAVPSPAPGPAGTDAGAIPRAPAVLFYQVRAFLDAATEGP
jgi:hypothetical protein